MKGLALVVCAGLVAIGQAQAQEGPGLAFSIGGGFTATAGSVGRRLDNGWNIQAGVGGNFSSYVGALIDIGYNSFGVNSGTLNALGFPDGRVHIFSATVDPILHVNPHGPVDLYLTGGGGLYHWYQEFSQPTTQTFTGFDPFFGFYTAEIPSREILSSYSTNKPGIDGGAGIAFNAGRHVKIFAEARFNRIFMNYDRRADFVPVTFGFRW